MANTDNPNKSKRNGNNTPGQTYRGGGGQLREGEKLDGSDPHFEDRTKKGSATKDTGTPPKTAD